MGERLPAYPRQVVEAYTRQGFWSTKSLTDHVRENAARYPGRAAYIAPESRISWAEYDELSSRIALGLVCQGVEPGERVAFHLPDRPMTHVLMLALEKAGAVAVGIGIRSREREIEHILRVSGATTLVTLGAYREVDYFALFERLTQRLPNLARHVVVSGGADARGRLTVEALLEEHPLDESGAALVEQRRLGPNELFMINSTSGTTGLPKCVMHTMNRWYSFTRWAIEAADLSADDVFLSIVPAPFGFGLWTAHITPTQLGVPTVLVERPASDLVLRMLERERVSVLACVSTSFIQLLNDPTFDRHDLSALKAMFTGGEAVPYQRSLEFEQRAGAAVLQFYGSNESGALSYTTFSDSQERRLTTAGKLIPEMQVRLFDATGEDSLAGPVRVGQPGCKGPTICPGYFDDPAANRKLFTEDGWLLLGDIVQVDEEGYLSVVGRVADIIIRGGANISAVKVEEELAAHPSVAMAAVVSMPDPVLGERVCAYVVPKEGATVTLADLTRFLEERGNTKYTFPERLEVVSELPLSTGGKVHKSELKADIERKLAAERASSAPAT